MLRFIQCCDSRYGPQALALFRSLQRHMSGEWCMDVYCLDDALWQTMCGLSGASPQPHPVLAYQSPRDIDFDPTADEIPGLYRALKNRSGGPWFWTWAAQATHHAIETHPEDVVAYLDTDCWVTADLRPVIEEVLNAGADIGSCDHRWPKHKADRVTRGDWWVGLNVFAPTIRARACAAWWAAWVRARCESNDPGDEYLGIPAGLAGDQPPLSAFGRMARHHKIQTPGLLASWNWDGHVYADVPGDAGRALGVFVNADGAAGTQQQRSGVAPIRLVHYHEFRFDEHGNIVKRTGYETPGCVTERLVAPYEAAVQAAAKELAGA